MSMDVFDNVELVNIFKFIFYYENELFYFFFNFYKVEIEVFLWVRY